MAYYGGYPGPQYSYPPAPSPTRQFYQEPMGPPQRPMRPARPPSPMRGGGGGGGMPRRSYNTRKIDPYDYGPDSVSRQYDYEGGYGGYGDMMYNTGPSLTSRRCCTAFIAGLVMLTLAGLGVGIYFAVTKSQESAAVNSVSKLVSNKGYSGYYVNGVYVVPVTSKPRDYYIIYGTDTPCNQFNNNSVTNPIYPDCNKVTTRIALATNWTTLKPPQLFVVPVGSAPPSLRLPSSPLVIGCWIWLALYKVLDSCGCIG